MGEFKGKLIGMQTQTAHFFKHVHFSKKMHFLSLSGHKNWNK